MTTRALPYSEHHPEAAARARPLRPNLLSAPAYLAPSRLLVACLNLTMVIGAANLTRCASAEPSHSNLTPLEIIRKSLVAERSTNVRGKELMFVEPPGLSATSTERDVTRTKAGICLYRWSAPVSQRGTVTYDDGTWTRCYVPSTREMMITRSTPFSHDDRSAAKLARLIARNYVVRLHGKENVSGRACYVVSLLPRSDMSHAYKVWVDSKTFYPVSKQENNAQGHTICLSIFRWIEFPAAIPAKAAANPFSENGKAIKPPITKAYENVADLRRSSNVDVCMPLAMPGGFEFQRCELINDESGPVQCLRFTDGWSSLSIYQSARETNSPASQPGLRAMHYSRTSMGDSALRYQTENRVFTLIGRVEMNGLVSITNSLDPRREQSYLTDTARTYRVPFSLLSSMRNLGFGLDTINAVLEISARSRKPVTGLIGLIRSGYAWRDVARLSKVDSRRFAARVRFFECH